MSVRRLQRRLKSGELHVRWVVDIGFRRSDGSLKRIRKVPRVQTRVAAERLERELLGRLEAEERDGELHEGSDLSHTAPPPSPPEARMPTLRAFWQEFFSTYVATNNKPSEQAAKKSIFDIHLDPVFGHLRLNAIGGREIERFKADKLLGDGRRYSAKSINNQLAVLRTMLRVAQRWGLLSQVPQYAELRLPEQQTRFLSPEEATQLVEACDEPWKTMVIVALNTGVRIGELIALKWADIDFERNHLLVRRSDWKGILGLPKGGRSRQIDLNFIALEALKKHRRTESPWLFSTPQRNRLSHAKCRNPLLKACLRAKVLPFQWHTLRHTFASRLVAKGVPLRAVQLLLGHANYATTERYIHLAPNFSASAVNCLVEDYK